MKTKSFLLGIVCLFFFSTVWGQQIGDGNEIGIDTFNKQLNSGGYNAYLPVDGYPQKYGLQTFKHLFHQGCNINGNHHALQISSYFPEDDNLYFRKITTNESGSSNYNSRWYELATRGENTFKGNQYMMGNLSVGDADYMDANDRLMISYWRDQSSESEKHGFIRYPKQFWIHPSAKPNAEGIHFNQNAEVGIGIYATPGYRLSVNGTIRASEIIVETFGADFVFESDYKLKPLSEVKSHIEENKHLPDIPSATQMQENGIGMSELSIKLLQKVEELTLYAIQQNETIEKLNKRIDELETNRK